MALNYNIQPANLGAAFGRGQAQYHQTQAMREQTANAPLRKRMQELGIKQADQGVQRGELDFQNQSVRKYIGDAYQLSQIQDPQERVATAQRLAESYLSNNDPYDDEAGNNLMRIIQAGPEALDQTIGAVVERGMAEGILRAPQSGQQPSLQQKDVMVNGEPTTVLLNPKTGVYTSTSGERIDGSTISPIPKKGIEVNLPSEKTKTALQGAMDKADAAKLTGYIEQANEAAGQNDTMALLEEMFDQGVIETGALEGRLLGVKSFLDDVGFSVNQEGMAAQELMEAATNEMALRARNPESGLGLTGNTSDQDVKFLKSLFPNLLRSENGNKAMIKFIIARNNRKQDIARLAREYATKNETMDGFDQYKSEWLKANPLFSKDEQRELIGLSESSLPKNDNNANRTSEIPQINDKGWVLMTDANGNRAYVSQDGTQFEEIK